MPFPVIVTPPAQAPVTLDAVKNYCRIDGTDDDGLLQGFIDAAVDGAEQFLNRSLITRTYKFTLDAFPVTQRQDAWWDGVRQGAIGSLLGTLTPIALPRGPVTAITSITTYDGAGVSSIVDLATYSLDAGGNVAFASSFLIPSGLRASSAVEILYQAGYGDSPASVPASIRNAILMQTAQFYDTRGCGELSEAAKAQLQPYRLFSMGAV